MGAFSYHRFIFLLARIDLWKVYDRLISTCTVKTGIKVKRQWFQLAKRGTLVGLLQFSPSFLFAFATSNRAKLAFKMTIIKDTHVTLMGIPFKVEANHSLIFLPLQTYEKKFAEFPFLFIFIIPCMY